jgi:hypothetical protein
MNFIQDQGDFLDFVQDDGRTQRFGIESENPFSKDNSPD